MSSYLTISEHQTNSKEEIRMFNRFVLIAITLFVCTYADYNTVDADKNKIFPTILSEINSLDPHESNLSEEYINYDISLNNAENSELTPKGYDYLSNADDSHLDNAQTTSSSTFPSVLSEHEVPKEFAPTHYSYNYAVNDDITGDIKDHSETRDGYVVRGSYSLVDPDGYKRTVTYTADNIHGFNAVVNRVPYTLKKMAVVTHFNDSYVNAAYRRETTTGGIYS